VLGLIPARGGSKGIPNKNLRVLAGKPLLAYTSECARACGVLTQVPQFEAQSTNFFG
jgi:CMP-N-acetylneuraminic acid synthetase